ncbi:YidC/Oxa1 family membrane protein insertase [Nocardioides terrae]|uniref:Membrane protein insertase YidC n=1 Tax=Nocardioides terrae TaxID=574651 RepID=A0A1I1NBF8_9ACTN|nr:membrane protein insertase YidC [Nocardioides terrae]SFC91070.1 YidC/Oxa1 family membrane protein insertase [Nocardioides terrae]
MGDLLSTIGTPLYYAISAIWLAWHRLFDLLPISSGWSWTLAIIGLTITIRALLIPLFVKQIKSSRNMQLIQPKVKELQKKYGHDRERLAQETMKLYKDTGTNPFASCLPLILQMPIFLSLFHLLRNAADRHPKGFLDQADVDQISGGKIFGAGISDTLTHPDNTNVVVLAVILVISMTATTFITQRQLMSKNMPADAMSGPYAQQQKLLLYVLPIVFAVGGIAFPIGLMLYWTTSNLWTMGQQFYVIRNNPAPGTPAAQAKADRDRAKAVRHGHGDVAVDTAAPAVEAPEEPRQRQQPKRQTREQRKQSSRPNQPKKDQ